MDPERGSQNGFSIRFTARALSAKELGWDSAPVTALSRNTREELFARTAPREEQPFASNCQR